MAHQSTYPSRFIFLTPLDDFPCQYLSCFLINLSLFYFIKPLCRFKTTEHFLLTTQTKYTRMETTY